MTRPRAGRWSRRVTDREDPDLQLPQDRVTDHRIGSTIHNVPGVLDGDLDRLIDALVMADQADRLRTSRSRRWRGTQGDALACQAPRRHDCRDRRGSASSSPVVGPIVKATDLGCVQVPQARQHVTC